MDSKQRDDMSGVLKLISSLVVLLIEAIIIVGWSYSISNFLEEKSTICINESYEKEKILEKVISKMINNSNDDINLNNSKLMTCNNTICLMDKEQSLGTDFKNINIKINGFVISIGDNIFGYITSIEQREAILQEVCQKYISELGLNTRDISKIIINGKIQATPDVINITQISGSTEISQEIYNASIIDSELLGLQMTVALQEEQIIPPEIMIENDENLYIGVEEIDEGKNGSKLVFKDVIYDGLNSCNETVVGEEIIVKSEPTIIKRGKKNPYNDGIAFLAMPTVGGYLSSYFGEDRPSSYHKGIDFAQNMGEEVFAAFPGTVSYCEYNNGGYGNLIIIEHENNMKTYYAHLNDIYISKGDKVKKGDVIGSIGNTGYSTGPHLHFELRVNDEPVNPIDFIVKEK